MKIALTISVMLALALTASAGSGRKGPRCTGKAMYKLTFDYQWTTETFADAPADAHFSPLTGITHGTRYSPFSKYGYASDGVKMVAETGSPFVFVQELTTAKADGLLHDFQNDGSAPNGGGSASVMVEASCSHRYVSAISMIAPSPDWILAIFRLSVVRRGKFVQSLSGSLPPWDAGTDSGKTIFAQDRETVPKQNIAPLQGPPFMSRPLATYKLEKM